MISGEKPAAVSKTTSFSAVVDHACERLKEKQVQYSIRRIHEMEDRLAVLERELNEFLLHSEKG
jgi:hypothetical protein